MGKLFKLKQWVTVPEAAKHLSIVCGEDVCEADVLRLVLDGHLKLSLYFLNTRKARLGKIVLFTSKMIMGINGVEIEIPNGIEHPQGGCIQLDKKVCNVSGVWDLCMVYNERIEVQKMYQDLIVGPELDLFNIDGIFFKSGDVIGQLQERFKDEIVESWEKGGIDRDEDENYFPAGCFPDDCMIVVRTEALRDFEQFLSENNHERPSNSEGKGTKVDALSAEIEDIIQQGTPAKSEIIWREMVARCGTRGSVLLNVEETDKGLVIRWRGVKAKINSLTKEALTERLRKRKTG